MSLFFISVSRAKIKNVSQGGFMLAEGKESYFSDNVFDYINLVFDDIFAIDDIFNRCCRCIR